MMIKPGITELDKCVDSRYTLVSMAAKRARMVGKERMLKEKEGSEPYNSKLDKPVTQAINEISDGIVGFIRSEAIEKAREYEMEKFNAISKMERDHSIDGANEDIEEYQDVESEEELDIFGDSDQTSAIDAALRAARIDMESAGTL